MKKGVFSAAHTYTLFQCQCSPRGLYWLLCLNVHDLNWPQFSTNYCELTGRTILKLSQSKLSLISPLYDYATHIGRLFLDSVDFKLKIVYFKCWKWTLTILPTMAVSIDPLKCLFTTQLAPIDGGIKSMVVKLIWLHRCCEVKIGWPSVHYF